jgi:hypothetical protein
MASNNASRGANDEAAALGQPVAAARGGALAWGISRNILIGEKAGRDGPARKGEILLSHPTYCRLIGPWFMVVLNAGPVLSRLDE